MTAITANQSDRPRVYRGRYYNRSRGYNNYRRYYSEERRSHCDNVYMTGPNFFRCER